MKDIKQQLEPEYHQRTFNQIMQIFILPEIIKRQKNNEIPKPYPLIAAQIVFKVNQTPVIRLNNEAKIKFKAKTSRKIKKGESISTNDIKNIIKIEKIKEDGNEAHITMLRLKNRWFFTFDFRYNRTTINKFITNANEFLNSSKNDFRQKRWRPFITNLFYCTEILVKCELILHPWPTIGKKHTYWKAQYNKWYKFGNTNKEYSEVYNQLFDLVNSARYSEDKFKINYNKAKGFLTTIESMLKRVVRLIS